MPVRPPAKPGAVTRAEALMAPRREGGARIPTLTDLVGAPGASVTTLAATPGTGEATAWPPAASPPASAERRALEDAVFERLYARLEAEMSELLAQRIVPEIVARLREAIPAAVEQALREGEPPRRP